MKTKSMSMSMAFRATRRFMTVVKLARANAAAQPFATVEISKLQSGGSGGSAMARFCGASSFPYSVFEKKIWDYVKESNLQEISRTRQFHSKMSSVSNIQPVPSPLTQIPALPSKRTEGESAAPCKRTVQAILKRIKQSPKKVNLVAALVRGMRVEDALLQMQVTVKRAAKTVYKVIHSARANATHNHGLDADRLIIAETFVGKGVFRKTLSYHAKGRCGIRARPQCRLTVVLRELTPEEEAEIARLRVQKFRRLSKRERQLVPHKLLETKWRWHRTQKDNVGSEATMA